MSVKVGDVIATPGMILRVTAIHGNYLKCDYWSTLYNAWMPRGILEKRKIAEERLLAGVYKFASCPVSKVDFSG